VVLRRLQPCHRNSDGRGREERSIRRELTTRHIWGATGSNLPQWVRKALTAEGVVVDIRPEKHQFTRRDLTLILVTLWTQDDLIFIPERYRLQFTLIFRMYCWTGAKLGAFFTGGFRWGVSCWNPASPRLHVCVEGH
jgi:hypothetical protein